jgi:hypothetical protein
LSSSSSTFQRKPSPLPPHPNTPLQSPGGVDNPKPDDALHIEHLERLREIFERAAKDGNGKLDGEMFMRACDRVFGKNRIVNCHMSNLPGMFLYNLVSIHACACRMKNN